MKSQKLKEEKTIKLDSCKWYKHCLLRRRMQGNEHDLPPSIYHRFSWKPHRTYVIPLQLYLELGEYTKRMHDTLSVHIKINVT